jgi:hypothetical protein
MDYNMRNEEVPNLQTYIGNYRGHQRFARLMSLIEGSHMQSPTFSQAIDLAYSIAANEKIPGMYSKI